MYVFCYFLGILILLCQSRGEDVLDCTNSDGESQTFCKKSVDLKDIGRESTEGQQSAPTEFICQLEGRFPDLSDSTCKRFFECERMNNGSSFNKKSSKCNNSTFCGSTQKCSSVYVCPCGATSNEMQRSPESQETTVTTTAHPCSLSLVTDFTCLSVGRFPDFNDLTCQSYFLCSHLYNGSYIKTKYKCQNSFFDPAIKKCSATFPCPCTVTTNTSAVTITTPTSVSTSAVTSSPLTGHTTYENITISSAMTSDALSTKHGCTIISKEFECTNEGRFPDLSDITCRKYFLCSKLQNGTFIKTSYDCKYSSFNPVTLRCSTDYVCPCTGDETTSTISSPSTREENKTIATTSSLSSTVTSNGIGGCTGSSQEFECADKGRFADLSDFNCKTYFLCSQLQNGTLIKTKYRCPNASTFYPVIQHCSSEYICPCSATTISSTTATNSPTVESSVTPSTISSRATTYLTSFSTTPIENSTIVTSPLPSSSEIANCQVSSEDFICTSKGRFPDLTDFSCQKYFLCSHLHNESFIKTKYRCPSSSYFYPPSEQCSTKYICPCTTTTTTSSSVSFTTTSPLNLSTVENPKTTIADSSKIPTTSTASFGNTSTSSSSYATITYSKSTIGCTVSYNEFQCTITGRFPDLSDTTCRKYFLCSQLLQNGSFIKTSYTCLNSTFNPLVYQCSINYVCPCNAEYTSVTTPMHSISTSEGFTKLPTTTSTAVITITSSYSCTSPLGNVPEFNCSSVGRFPDYYDITCRKYFLCSQLHNGTFVKTPYICPVSSCINSSTQRCSSSCNCPCLN